MATMPQSLYVLGHIPLSLAGHGGTGAGEGWLRGSWSSLSWRGFGGLLRAMSSLLGVPVPIRRTGQRSGFIYAEEGVHFQCLTSKDHLIAAGG